MKMNYKLSTLIAVFLLLPIIFFTGCRQNFTKEITDLDVNSNETLQKHLLQGWNTWNNPSVLSVVKMPDGLNLQLVFRKKRGGPYWLKDAYISNKRQNFPEKITPIAHAYDGSYIEMELEWEGLKANIQIASDEENLVYLYTPETWPQRPHIMALQVGYIWNKSGYVLKNDQEMRAYSGDKVIEIHSSDTDAGYALPISTPYFSFDSSDDVMFYTGEIRTSEELKAFIDEKKAAFDQGIEQWGDLSETYHAMQAVNAWNIIYDANNDRLIAPVSRVWNEAWGGYIIFDWDTYFTGLMLAVDDKQLGYANCIAITNSITEEGFIPNLETAWDLKSFDRSQPPVGSITCKLLYDKFKDKWFLEEVYKKLLSWNEWWAKERDNQGYLSWGSDDHPLGLDGHSLQGAKWESGLDNSPLFDEAIFNPDKEVLELASVGLMGLYIADCKNLIEIANILGYKDDIQAIQMRADKYTQALHTLWDEESGIYRDKNLVSGKFTDHLAPTNFYPLLAMVPTQDQAERMINEHFFDPEEFYGDWILPSIARNDSAYQDNSYWRGRIWAPMNFLVYLGLLNYNLPQAKEALAEKSQNLILKEWEEHRYVYENYNAETGVGGDVENSSNFYAWGGLLGLIAIMEEGKW